MKKTICIFGCVMVIMLAGCQAQLEQSNTETNSGQIIENSVPDFGTTSESDSVNTDADSKQTNSKDNAGTDAISGDDPAKAPTQSAPISGDGSWSEDDSFGHATLLSEERELKKEGSLRGEIEVSHKLPCGKVNLSEGNTVLFRIETKSDGAELKITLTGAETGTVLEGSGTGSGNISFEIDIADEYTVVLENCSLSGVKFTIDYSIGGSI